MHDTEPRLAPTLDANLSTLGKDACASSCHGGILKIAEEAISMIHDESMSFRKEDIGKFSK